MRGVGFCLFLFWTEDIYNAVSFCLHDMKRLRVHIHPLPLEPSSRSPLSTPLGGHRAPSFAAQQIPTIYTQ